MTPIHVEESVAGLLLVGWSERHKITLSPEQVQHMREILALLASTLSR